MPLVQQPPSHSDAPLYALQSKSITQSRYHRETFSAISVLSSYPYGTESSPLAESLPNAPSPARSSSGSSTSAKSVQWGENDDSDQRRIIPGQYSTRSPKSPRKSVLKRRGSNNADMPSLFATNTPILAASAALDSFLCDLLTCVKQFKCPSELDFSANTGSPMILANVKKNEAFINQLLTLGELRARLARIPTHGDAQLEEKHKAAGMAIKRALQRMKEWQLKLYENFTKSVDTALDDIATDFKAAVANFEPPSELDFSTNSKDQLVLRNTERNKSFIDVLRRLAWFREALNSVPDHGSQELQDKRRSIGMAIERSLQWMKEHQLKLHRLQHMKAY